MKTCLLLILVCFMLSSTGLFGLEPGKDPYKAMAFSALFPGGGQLYNRSYIKTAAVIGLQAYIVNSALYNYNRKQQFSKLLELEGNSDNPYYLSRRKHYDENLKSDIWWIGTVLVLSVADAFVDAHLYNFEPEKAKIKVKFKDKMLGMEYRF